MQKTGAFTCRILRLLALIAACALLACAPALAIDKIDETRTVTLTAVVQTGGAALPGVELRLYKVADMHDFGTFAPCGAFAEYPVDDMNGLDSEGWRDLAYTLAGFAAADAPAPADTAVTDENGGAAFGMDGTLGVGLYLLTGDSGIFQPTLVALPGRDENDEWIYDVTVNLKPGTGGDETIALQVLKVWNDGDFENRPGQVRVLLLGDGQIVESVTLDKTNNWRHEWTGLDGDVNWQVVERPVPDGYTVSTQREDTLITITNTRPVDDGDDDGGGEDPKLPQTGLLWWPVPVLAGAGMSLFAAGWMRRRKHED